MKALIRLACHRLTTDRAAAGVGQIACFAAAIVLFALAVLKLCSLRLPEGQLIIGLLNAIACTLLLVILGLLLPLAVRADSRELTKRST